jgi:(p)ppGpp synthase/HD superfamily hydrolase
MTHDPVTLVTRAADFAARAHIAQHRKGLAGEPYVNHLTEVAALLAEATGGTDAELVAAGYLHDTLEDTAVRYEDLSAQFGAEIAQLVAEVTDDKSLPKAERKRLQVETVTKKSARARLLKIADKTSNLRSLVASPPAGWSKARLLEYVDWAEAVVCQVVGCNQVLDRAFAVARDNARREISAKVDQEDRDVS